MSPAEFFQIEYIINPYMAGNVKKVNNEIAKQQWQALHKTVKNYADVELIDAENHLPDLVFTANAGFTSGNVFIPSNFRYSERQPEEPLNRQWFEQHGFTLCEIPKNIYFEGEGDALLQPGTDLLWMGYGIRSEKKSIEFIKRCFNNLEILPIKLINESFYHLDTCFCPLLDGTILYYPEAFDEYSNQLIENTVPATKRIPVSKVDAENFACNAICIKNAESEQPIGHIILNKASTKLREQLENLSYEVIETPTTEFLKAGGATKCMTLNLNVA